MTRIEALTRRTRLEALTRRTRVSAAAMKHDITESTRAGRHAISEASKDLILLQETLDYLEESLVSAKVPSMPQDARCKRLFR